jgi:hypothetical protein
VLSKAHLRADLLTCRPDEPAEWVVVTFTERCNRDLDGPGFGTDFLLREGFDVLAVRNCEDDWYVDLTPDDLQAMNQALEPYGNRASYGSSMGGYAAIKFAGALGVRRAVAISPILDIQFEWDTRHWDDIPVVRTGGFPAAGDMLVKADISLDTTYHVAVDPLCREDIRHAGRLCEMAPKHHVFNVRLGGHPVGPTMLDSGILGAYVKQAIAQDSIDGLTLGNQKSGRFLYNLARHLLERRKLRSAAIANSRALSLAPDWGEAHLLQAQISHRLGCAKDTEKYGLRAIELEPRNPYVVAIVARALLDQQNRALAKQLVESGLERMGSEGVLIALRNELN